MINVNPTITSLSESSAKLSGDLNAHTVTALLPQGLKLLNQAPEAWLLDMTDVKQVSSAAVALLLEWLKQAEQSNKRIEITGMPEQMFSFIEICGLEPLFAPLFRTTS